jgi:hypothetical protein
VLSLPGAERAQFGFELLDSIGREPDPDIQTAWAEEIERRAQSDDSSDVDSEVLLAEKDAGHGFKT